MFTILKLTTHYNDPVAAAREKVSMRSIRCLRGLAIGTLMVLMACSRDPNVRKRRYFESGERYFAQQNYRAALIQYSNAIKADANYEEAHYQLAQCYMRLGMWSSAYGELTQAVSIKPDDLKAQLALGNLLLAGREFKRAQDIARTTLAKDPNNVDAHVLLANSYAGLNDFDPGPKPDRVRQCSKLRGW